MVTLGSVFTLPGGEGELPYERGGDARHLA